MLVKIVKLPTEVKKVTLVKLMRRVFGLGLKETVDLVDRGWLHGFSNARYYVYDPEALEQFYKLGGKVVFYG